MCDHVIQQTMLIWGQWDRKKLSLKVFDLCN